MRRAIDGTPLAWEMFQSTHPRGVRQRLGGTVDNHNWFQSTHPRGVRLLFKFYPALFLMFQSTHPRGVRPEPARASAAHLCFNPRTHAGCDNIGANPLFKSNVSIHAPTRGATRLHKLWLCGVVCFNPRTHAGCDKGTEEGGDRVKRFNPRTHAGCDPKDSL